MTAVGTHAELLRTSEHYRYVISSLEADDAERRANEAEKRHPLTGEIGVIV